MFQYFKRRKFLKSASDTLFINLINEARSSELYADDKITDDPDGRFEAISLFASAYLSGLSENGQIGKDIAQEVFNKIFKNFDQGLRELGVSDMAVGKRNPKMGEKFYGRQKSYNECLLNGNIEHLKQKIALNVFGETDKINPFIKELAQTIIKKFNYIKAMDLSEI